MIGLSSQGYRAACGPITPCPVNSNNFETLSVHVLGKERFFMRESLPLVVIASLLLLTAQQDLPVKGPGRFQATATGVLKGKLEGNIAGTVFADGRTEYYVMIDSHIMMSQNVMVSAVISLPAGKQVFPQQLTPSNTRLQIEKLDTQELLIVPATGTIEMRGRDLVDGKFTITSSDARATLNISGEFQKAPIIPGIAQTSR